MIHTSFGATDAVLFALIVLTVFVLGTIHGFIRLKAGLEWLTPPAHPVTDMAVLAVSYLTVFFVLGKGFGDST